MCKKKSTCMLYMLIFVFSSFWQTISSCLGQIHTHTHTQKRNTRALFFWLNICYFCVSVSRRGNWVFRFANFTSRNTQYTCTHTCRPLSVYALCCAFIFSHFLIKIFNDFARAHGPNEWIYTHLRRGQQWTYCFFNTYICHRKLFKRMHMYGWGGREAFVVLFSKQFIYLLLFISCATRGDVLASRRQNNNKCYSSFTVSDHLLLYCYTNT